jgi:hypothetical protein
MPRSMPTPNLGGWSYRPRSVSQCTKIRYTPRQGKRSGSQSVRPRTWRTHRDCARYDGERIVSKCARKDTTKVGVSHNMLAKLDAVLGAFEEQNGSYRVLRLPAQRCATLMQQAPTASRGPSSGKVSMVSRAVSGRMDYEGSDVAGRVTGSGLTGTRTRARSIAARIVSACG